MKRKMVIIGISYILGLFFASFFTHNSFWIIAVISAAAFVFLILFKTLTLKAVVLSSISLLVGVSVYSGYTVYNYKPIISLEGKSTIFVGEVQSVDEYAGETASYILKGEFENGIKGSVICLTDNYDCRYGDYMRVRGTFSIPEKTYLYDSPEYYKGMSIFLKADTECVYTVLYTDDYPFLRKIQDYRERLQRRMYSLCGRTGGSLVSAMLFGNREGLDEHIESAFYNAGLSPMLALSGFHLILFSSFCNIVGKRTRLQRIIQFLMITIMTLLFSVISMWPISVIRAGIMLIIDKGSCIFCRRSDSLSSLLIAVIILTLLNPYLIYNVSFLLSVSGTFALNSFAPWLIKKITVNGYFGVVLRDIISIGIVTLCTLPICMKYFSQVSLLSPISNTIFAPMCILIIVFGMIIFFIGGNGFICDIFGDIINAVSKLLADGLLFMQSHISLSMASGFDALLNVLFVFVIMTVFVIILTKSRKMTAVSIIISFAVLFSGQFMLLKRFESKLRVFVLGRNTGQVVVVTYAGRTDVIDFAYDRKNVAHLKNFLYEYGISNIDCLYLTDNVSAAAVSYNYELYEFDVDTVLISSDIDFGENRTICRNHPVYSDFFKITAPLYEISEYDMKLTVSAYGKTVLVQNFNSALPSDSSNYDYVVSGYKKNQSLFEMSQGEPSGLMCDGNNIEIIMNDDGEVYARRLY